MTAVLIVLYVIGFALELYGLVTVARDIRDAQSAGRDIAERQRLRSHGGTVRSGAIERARRSRDPLKALAIVAQDQERQLRSAVGNQKRAEEEARADLVEVLVGNLGRRRRGLYALVIGLFVSSLGNVFSAFC